jgi:D-psicose/D-tagatose/L-ribulose 3-epimerase
MKYGIYYAYWEKYWQGDYKFYIKKVAKLGFDILEIACTPIPDYSDKEISEIRNCADAHGIVLTAGYGPSAKHNIASSDTAVVRSALMFYEKLFEKLEKLNISCIGGGIYSYWPVDYSKKIDKEGDRERSIIGIQKISRLAEDHGITLMLEVLNRFEGYLINTAQEGIEFIREVDRKNVMLMLDTFHMNIEEDSFGNAIRSAKGLLGHFHVGECNRRVPGKGRIPWREIGDALNDIGYNGAVVMEPFVQMGGQVGSDIKVWRDMSEGGNTDKLDRDAALALNFIRYMFEKR